MLVHHCLIIFWNSDIYLGLSITNDRATFSKQVWAKSSHLIFCVRPNNTIKHWEKSINNLTMFSGLFVFCSQICMKESKYTFYSRCISNSKVLLQWSRYKSQLTKTPAAKIWRLLHPLSLSHSHFLPLKTTSWGGAKLGSALLVVFSSLPNGGFPLLRRPLAPPRTPPWPFPKVLLDEQHGWLATVEL